MFGVIAFILLILAAIFTALSHEAAWIHTALFYAGVAFIALEMTFPQRGLRGPIARV
jgi:membrane-bound ClpP family serine protease